MRSLDKFNKLAYCADEKDATHKTVKIGDMIAPYCAALDEDDSFPFVVGERHRIQIPHQHIILLNCQLLEWVTRSIQTDSPKYGGRLDQAQKPFCNTEVKCYFVST